MKPILFKTEMVQAILDGRKTMTRRIITPQPLYKTSRKFVFDDKDCPKKLEDSDDFIRDWAKYHIGDILYVRETWAQFGVPQYLYKASDDGTAAKCGLKWHPSIHMPREAARLFLRECASGAVTGNKRLRH